MPKVGERDDEQEEQVSDALGKGAVCPIGRADAHLPTEGFYFPPTVLLNVNHSMTVMRDESFGPLIGIQVASGLVNF